MKKASFLLILIQLFCYSAFSQEALPVSNSMNSKEIKVQLEELTKLYNTLKAQLDLTQSNLEKGTSAVNNKVENIGKDIDTKINGLNSRTENVEKKLKITDKEREEFQNLNVSRNQLIEENFSQYIKFYGDKYNQLDEKLNSEELAIEFRKIINPQSGSLGFKLSDKLQQVLSNNYNALIDKILKDGSKKTGTKLKIANMLSTVTSVLENPVVNDVTSIIPFASTIKSIIGTTSGLVLNTIVQKDIKKEYQSSVVAEIKNSQNLILADLNQIILFYDHMAKLDNEYLMRLQNIRSDVSILGIELREFCFNLEIPLKKIDPAFSIDKKLNTRETTIQISKKLDIIKNNAELNKNYLVMISNMTFDMKIRSRDLYNNYREIQELKILANNKFVTDFNKIISQYNIAITPDIVTKKLSEKNVELIAKMNFNHTIDKSEFEEFLNKIYELN